ncbi:MAG: hypothetical protein B6D58_09540 [candidate division Zixibacteria bacterium 4484_95]|nr:MAG: hypothetical protein B6D58_09540 [candidate division Zixibacteria bacterium 4484_95]
MKSRFKQLNLFKVTDTEERKRLLERRKEIEKMLLREPDNPDYHIMYAAGMLLLGEYTKAEIAITKALLLCESFLGYAILGDVFMAQEKFQEAEISYKKALAVVTEEDKITNADFIYKIKHNLSILRSLITNGSE